MIRECETPPRQIIAETDTNDESNCEALIGTRCRLTRCCFLSASNERSSPATGPIQAGTSLGTGSLVSSPTYTAQGSSTNPTTISNADSERPSPSPLPVLPQMQSEAEQTRTDLVPEVETTQASSEDRPRRRLFGRLRNIFRRSREGDTANGGGPTPITAANYLNQGIGPLISITPVEDDGPSDVRRRAQRIQQGSSIAARGSWVLKRDTFLDILKRLKDHGDFFTAAIQLDQTQETAARLLRSEKLNSLFKRYQEAGDGLNHLVKSLAQLQGGKQTTLEVMMHQDPFQLQTALQKDTADSRFRPHSAAFYTRCQHKSVGVSVNINSSTQDQQPASQVLPTSDPQYLCFDVARRSAKYLPSCTKINTVQVLFNSIAASDEEATGWPRLLGYMGESIHTFLDSTPHSTEKTLARALVDEDEQQELKESFNADFRARLGLTVASSILCRLHSEGPKELEATHLCYYPWLNEDGHQLALRESRINPFMPIRMSVTGSIATSSAAVFSAGASDVDVATLMIRKLGILLYEIGTWSRVAGGRLSDNVRSVRVRKEALAIISPVYRDVTGSCLDYRREINTERWMLENVVEPLSRVVDNLARVDLLR